MQGVSEYREMEFRQPYTERQSGPSSFSAAGSSPLRLEEPKVREGWFAVGCGVLLALVVLVPISLSYPGLAAAHKAKILDKILGYGGLAIALLILLGYCLRDRRPRLKSRVLEFRRKAWRSAPSRK